MNHDADLLRTLAATDAALPPPSGLRVTAASLQARVVRLRVQRGIVATLLLAAAGIVFALARTPAPTPSVDPLEVAELRAEIEALKSRVMALELADTAFRMCVDRAAHQGLRADVASRHFAAHYPLRARTPGAEETR